MSKTLSPELLKKMDAWWRAANYLSVGQIYLYDNPLLKRTADARAHQAATARPLGHDAGIEFYLRASQSPDQAARSEHDLHHRPRPWRAGHGGQYVSGRHVQRGISRDLAGRGRDEKTFQAVSFPGGIPSHVAPETPGSIHEGGELGYSLVARVSVRRSTIRI